MQDYVINLRQRFRNGQHLATFMGVTVDAINSWTSGRRKPRGAELRMIEVLGTIAERAPWLLEGMLGPKPVLTKPVLTKLEPVAPPRNERAEREAAQAEMRRRWELGELDSHIGTLDDDEYELYRIDVLGFLPTE